jgi:hypothetical protein
MSLVLYGETRTGKTLWARSLGPHIYNVGLVSGSECIKAGHDAHHYEHNPGNPFRFHHVHKQ